MLDMPSQLVNGFTQSCHLSCSSAVVPHAAVSLNKFTFGKQCYFLQMWHRLMPVSFNVQALEKNAEAGGSLDKYEIEGPDRPELLQDLGEFQLATVGITKVPECSDSVHAESRAMFCLQEQP